MKKTGETINNPAIEEWIQALNSLKEYGKWRGDISFNVAGVDGIIEKHSG
jgi:hypothetical protein